MERTVELASLSTASQFGGKVKKKTSGNESPSPLRASERALVPLPHSLTFTSSLLIIKKTKVVLMVLLIVTVASSLH